MGFDIFLLPALKSLGLNVWTRFAQMLGDLSAAASEVKSYRVTHLLTDEGILTLVPSHTEVILRRN